MIETLQQKIDYLLQIHFNALAYYTFKEDLNKALQEFREQIQDYYNKVEINHKSKLAQAVYAQAMLDVLALLGEKK